MFQNHILFIEHRQLDILQKLQIHNIKKESIVFSLKSATPTACPRLTISHHIYIDVHIRSVVQSSYPGKRQRFHTSSKLFHFLYPAMLFLSWSLYTCSSLCLKHHLSSFQLYISFASFRSQGKVTFSQEAFLGLHIYSTGSF